MVFNTQSRIQIGGLKDPVKDIIDRPFEGIIAGLVFNSLRVLDFAAEEDSRTLREGDVELLTTLPARLVDQLGTLSQQVRPKIKDLTLLPSTLAPPLVVQWSGWCA